MVLLLIIKVLISSLKNVIGCELMVDTDVLLPVMWKVNVFENQYLYLVLDKNYHEI